MGVADADRPLTERGIRDARLAGAELAAHASAPDLVRCSTALRTRQTIREVAGRIGAEIRVDVEHSLYTGDEDTVLDLIRQTDDAVGTLLVVGHNPTAHGLVWRLLADEQVNRFPPGAFAIIELPSAWATTMPASGVLRRFWTPDLR
jgi:phosphohistidine phosphatase